MSGSNNNKRAEKRLFSYGVNKILIYQDLQDRPYAALKQSPDLPFDIYNVLSVVGVARDLSQTGIGIQIEGQQKMSRNILHPDERYLLKVTFFLSAIPRPLASLLTPEEDAYYLFIKSICRWAKPAGLYWRAGFEILEPDPHQVVELMQYWVI